MKLIDLFSNKDFPLDKLHANLKTSYGPVNEFISTYKAALLGWSEWATGLNEAMLSMVKTQLPAFDQPTLQTT